jgi:hypothetical protein
MKKMAQAVFIPMVFALSFFPILTGCIIHDSTYRVYYSGSGHTAGSPPVDSRAYNPGDTAVVKEKPAELKKGDKAFLGWRRLGYGDIYAPETRITVGYEDIQFEAVWEGDIPFTYKVEAGEITITGYEDYRDSVVIPDTLENKPITRIGERAFYKKYISFLTLPKDLTVIEDNAFAFNSLEKVVIPDKVRRIGINAFQRSGISDLILGEELREIGDYAFIDNEIRELALPAGVEMVGAGAFDLNAVTLIEIGGDVEIKSDSSLGRYGESFGQYYARKQKAAGIYHYKKNLEVWEGPLN